MRPERAPKPTRGAPTLDGLIAALAASPSLPGAACKGEAPLFDLRPDADGEPAAERRSRHTLAVSICHACPALDACREWAARMPTSALRGVVAGRIHYDHTKPERNHR